MDYGHPLQFGTFVTPVARASGGPVELAKLSEELGYDLVTFQDHPYQPGFFDTWTLLSYVAAATSKIHFGPNVLNLPLRPAPVLARAAASLDIMSGGRLVLGLGSGAFWEAIAAMGGPNLTPGEAVDALSEGIDLIRNMWDVDNPALLRGGKHYAVSGAKRGPAPAHDVPIWVGALKPRMQRLVGRQADGWLPSLNYLKPGDLQAGNKRIDDAATAAGRMPSDVRRIVNISGRESKEQLTDLAIEDGVSGFILASDNPNMLAAFAGDVMPHVRETVAKERAQRGTAITTRTSAALAARRAGIDYNAIPDSLREHAVEPGDFAYRAVRSTYMRGGRPGIVLRPQTVPEVVDALAYARTHRAVPLGVRSGGHGISGRSTNNGGIVIDVGALNDVEVLDAEAGLVRVGAGARWGDVAAVLDPYGLALTSGDFGGVGVGGLATAGGIGFLGREQGLTIDRMVSAEIVLADGAVVHASADENPDIFWAVRGAGANIGIAVSFTFRAGRATDVGWVQLSFDASETARFLQDFGATMQAAPRDVTLFLILSGPQQGRGAIGHVYGVVNSADPDTILERLQPFARIAPLVQQSITLAPYASVMANAGDNAHDGQGEPYFRSGLLNQIDADSAAIMAELVTSGASPWFQIRATGGATSDVAKDATAYAHRDAQFSIAAVGRSAAFEQSWDELATHFDGLYLSFDSRVDADVIAQAFPADTLARLREIKHRVDPDGVFRDNFTVAD